MKKKKILVNNTNRLQKSSDFSAGFLAAQVEYCPLA